MPKLKRTAEEMEARREGPEFVESLDRGVAGGFLAGDVLECPALA